MAAIDLIVLGMLKQKPMSAYDLQKQIGRASCRERVF